jgi:hypothetical protein
VAAGPGEAATWRRHDLGSFWKGVLPNLMFPADRSWLLSTLWDDGWSCLGGPAWLVARFLRHPDLQVRPVTLGAVLAFPYNSLSWENSFGLRLPTTD